MFEKINNLEKPTGKCDYQHQYKFFMQADMVSTFEGFMNNSPLDVDTPFNLKNPGARQF